ncbi:hypothetical protein EVG20_g8168 [Dentipellis fragilis]|uniref:RING-type domain-containing protein n=1 Tax=Dentipellis fragilis TaxID=205917 RepID=A0A4Y9YC03_9AGAM|nr:hypothetical protein EVG20_g8168 [Dentipellis fragilis]
MHSGLAFWTGVLLLFALVLHAQAYIPALSTNDTGSAIAGGPNLTDHSNLFLQWFDDGFYSQTVSYQLVKTGSNGISKVRADWRSSCTFSESVVKNDSSDFTSTPWIALVSCDFNATNASQEDDIFTLARDRGAVGALLYSEWSQACIINPEYADPANFEQVMDIYSTQSLSSARLIESQFVAINITMYGTYDPGRLNASQADINNTLQAGYVTAPEYLWATLDAYNSTGDPHISRAQSNNGTGGGGGGGGSSKTTLAMIVLYAITGCVSAMFCIVIIAGAIRAIRHPERYRMTAGFAQGGQGFGGQGRTGVLTRAILDTFPIIKFGTNTDENAPAEEASKDPAAAAEEGKAPAIEMKELEDGATQDRHAEKNDIVESPVAENGRSSPAVATAVAADTAHTQDEANAGESSGSTPRLRPAAEATPGTAGTNVVTPDNIGRETCPICIVDFEEGDDLRVLPCEGKHRFHQACVDPWLLELSSSCPICRQDFQALETMMSGESEEDYNPYPEASGSGPAASTPTHGSHPPRFSRYLRFARRRHHPMDQPDPTDPPGPLAADVPL